MMKATMKPEPEMRFTVEKSQIKGWLVIDNHAPRCEDAVIYRFSSKKKAVAFKAMMDEERGL